MRRVNDWLEGFMMVTDNSEPCALYRKWTGLWTIAANLQRRCFVRWGVEEWHSNIYCVLVGPPAARKGTALRQAREFVEAKHLPMCADKTSGEKLIKALENSTRDYVNTEQSLLGTHSSLNALCSELTTFIGYEDINKLTILCDLYDCQSHFQYDTFAHEKIEVANVWLNLLGATTPNLLQASLPTEAIGGGFCSRTIFVFSPTMGKKVYKPSLSLKAEKVLSDLLDDYEDIGLLTGEFKVDAGFESIYPSWRDKSDEIRFRDERLDYYVQRRPAHLFKLCMLLSASRSDSMVIEAQDLERANELLVQTEILLPRVFEGVGANPMVRTVVKMMRVIEERRQTPKHELYRLFMNDLNKRGIDDAISHLKEIGWCHEAVTQTDSVVVFNPEAKRSHGNYR